MAQNPNMKELVSFKSSFAHSVQRLGKTGLKIAGNRTCGNEKEEKEGEEKNHDYSLCEVKK